jgi:6-phosphogluconolactonase (cycloisomerase 2 family)
MRTISALTRISVLALVSTSVLAVGGVANAAPGPHAVRVVGHVYEPTDSAAGNAVAVFDRYADGSLRPAGTVATGGLGLGASLASQGGIARDGDLLFVVNAGDDTLSALSTKGGWPTRTDTIGSGGAHPVSVTVRNGVGYVLNHDSDTVSGFTYSRSGDLTAIPGSTRSLTPNPAGGLTDAAQVQLSPNGRTLVVTERGSRAVDTFDAADGSLGAATSHPSAGAVPYGFDFDRRGTLVVSEASGSASSYRIQPTFVDVTEALVNTQAAACWLVVSGDYAWVVNAASASISSYRIGHDGSLTLVAAVAAATGAGPTDAAVAPDGDSLHVRMRDGSVSSFGIGRDGALSSLGSDVVTSATGSAGLVAD